jgi:N-acetylneuraminic acid mutarotase
VAGAYAGVSGGSLVVAGGASYPGKKPWEGGTKVWHDTVSVLERPDGSWKSAGRLPRPLACGVSVAHRDSLVCVGGSDKERHYSECFRLEWRTGKLIMHTLPSLPRPLANSCGAVLGDILIVAGGIEQPDAVVTMKAAYVLDLVAEKPRWKELPAWPEPPRMLATAAAFDGAFWLIGGVDVEAGPDGASQRKYLRDAFRFDPGNGWTRVADLPHPVAAAPSPCPTDESGFYMLGGDDGAHVGFTPPEKHPGFTRSILRFDLMTGKWAGAGEWETPRVTTPALRWRNRWVIPSGEVRPGVRSPDVWAFTPDGKR